MPVIIRKITVGPLETNCYVVSCEISGNAFIIDPGNNPKSVIDYIHRNEFIPKAVILTHGHPDHIGAVKILRGGLNVPIMIHHSDVPMLKLAGIDSAEKYLIDGELLGLGRERFTVIHTPGHTPGSVCFSIGKYKISYTTKNSFPSSGLFAAPKGECPWGKKCYDDRREEFFCYGENILFSGDTLFRNGVGRTDLPGGSSKELEDSLKNKIFILPPDTIVYPGHGPETTIGNEISSG